jgi:hypothetical protein
VKWYFRVRTGFNWLRVRSSSKMHLLLCKSCGLGLSTIEGKSYSLYLVNQSIPASHRGGPGSIPGQSMWDLWWTKWNWDRFFHEYFGFPLFNFIPPVLHYMEKHKKLITIFTTGFHNKLLGCGASACAAGPFSTKKKTIHTATFCRKHMITINSQQSINPIKFTVLFPDIFFILYYNLVNNIVHVVGLSVVIWLSTVHGVNNI